MVIQPQILPNLNLKGIEICEREKGAGEKINYHISATSLSNNKMTHTYIHMLRL